MRMFLESCCSRTVARAELVAVQANLIDRFAELYIVLRAVHVVAIETGYSAAVHHALDEIVSLHAVFVRGTVGEMSKALFAELVVFELPVIAQILAYVIADRPVVIIAPDRTRQRASLRVALDAGVIGADIVHARGIQDVAARGVLDMLASRAVALLAADVPLRYVFGLNIVLDRVAAVASWTGWALHVVGRIKRFPPIPSFRDKVRPPGMVGYIPLRRLGKIIVADLCEVALLPHATIDQRNIFFCEFLADVVRSEVGNDGFRMLARIADDVGHRSFFPVFVDFLVAFLACRGANIVRGFRGGSLLRLFLWSQAGDATNVEDELPRIGVVLRDVRISPGGHARE